MRVTALIMLEVSRRELEARMSALAQREKEYIQAWERLAAATSDLEASERLVKQCCRYLGEMHDRTEDCR